MEKENTYLSKPTIVLRHQYQHQYISRGYFSQKNERIIARHKSMNGTLTSLLAIKTNENTR